MAERPDDVVDLVRCAEGKTERRLRQLISREARHILLVDGACNGRILTVEHSILTSHDALQLRELRHHARHEIGFREFGGTLCTSEDGIGRIPLRHLLNNRRRECHEALCFFVHRAKSLLKHDRFQLFAVLSEGLPAILIKEELRIGKTRTQDSLVAVCHDIKMLLAAVAHGDKDGQETSVRRLDREVALMVSHRRNHSLGGKRQILFLE